MTQPALAPEAILIISFACIAIAAGTIVARLYLRLAIQRRGLLASDALICAAWLAGLANTCLLIIYLNLGALEESVRWPYIFLPGGLEAFEKLLKLLWLTSIPFWTSCALSKAALLATYLQIFPSFMVVQRILLWATAAYTASAYIASITWLLLLCTPVSVIWDLTSGSTCAEDRAPTFFTVTWALNFVSNILIFGLPWLLIPRLIMTRALRIALFGTFSLGAITITFDVLRYVILQASDKTTTGPLSTNLLWTNLDCNVGIIVACLPSLRPYLGKPKGEKKAKSSGNERSSISMGSRKGRRNESSHPQSVRSAADGTNGMENGFYDEELRGNTSEVGLVEEDHEERTLAGGSIDDR